MIDPIPADTASFALHRLRKQFPGVVAVNDVDLTVRRGELHGIIGRNGAGKSVLVSLIAGLIRPSAGDIQIGRTRVDGRSYTPARAHDLGVSLIPQEPKFAPLLSVTDNIFMGRPAATRLGLLKLSPMTRAVKHIIDTLDVAARPGDAMGDLPIEAQQLLAFGKAFYVEKAQVILLDEITASLSRQRKQMLLDLLREMLRQRPDVSVTLISHHIAEIMEFCDRVTVMRDGRAVETITVAETTERELANYIVGNEKIVSVPPPSRGTGERRPPVLRVSGLGDGAGFRDLSFDVAPGEVVGLAGLDGSGKEEALEMLCGLRPPATGEIRLNGKAVRPRSPGEAIHLGIAYLPKNRERQAVIQNQTVEVNTLISAYRQFADRLGLLRLREARASAEARTEALAVKTPSVTTPVDYLSGGNKQKVMINRIAMTKPAVFVLNEPTRGVDIASKPVLLTTVRTELSVDSGVVLTSESEEELIDVCDRILVFFRGDVVARLERGDPSFTVQTIYKVMQGVESP